jgi:hypothetical protein
MAWGFIMELPMSQEEYDALDAAVGPEDPPGLILHTGSATAGGGFRIIDVWESKAAYEKFEQETLMPAWLGLGGDPPDGPLPREEFDVHNMRGAAG